MGTGKKFNDVEPMKFWVQKVLPMVYDGSLTYYEVVAKVTQKLNEVIANNNEMPSFIAELIKEYISSGEINKIINDILSEYFLNVKNPPNGVIPASGDGSTDDTNAIQSCIDYVNSKGGGSVYFPSGVYLTRSLNVRSNVTLFGFDRQNTRLVLMGGEGAPLLHGNVDNFSVNNLQLDGNMDIQVNNLNLINIVGKNIYMSDLILTDGYTLIDITLNDGYFQADNILMVKAVTDGISLKGVGFATLTNVVLESLSALNGRFPLNIEVNNTTVHNFISKANANVGINVNADNCYITGNIINSVASYVNSGVNNTIFINNGDSIVSQKSMVINSITATENIDIKTENLVSKVINTESIDINSEQPIKYKNPSALDRHFKTIPMKDRTGNEYKVLVEGSVPVGNIYLQETEPTEVNDETVWYHVNGMTNLTYGDFVIEEVE